jgi:hypothetical protein
MNFTGRVSDECVSTIVLPRKALPDHVKSRMAVSALLVWSALTLTRVGIGASARFYPLTVLSDNPNAYWRLDEPGGNVAHDRIGGHDCLFTNVQLEVAGYSAADPDTAEAFGLLAASNSYAGELDKSSSGIATLNFAQPSGSNAEFSVEAWAKGSAQTRDAGIVAKGYGNGGEQFNLDTGSDTSAVHGFRGYGRERATPATRQPDAGGPVRHAVQFPDDRQQREPGSDGCGARLRILARLSGQQLVWRERGRLRVRWIPPASPAPCDDASYTNMLETGIYPLGITNSLRAQYIAIFATNANAMLPSNAIWQAHQELFAPP